MSHDGRSLADRPSSPREEIRAVSGHRAVAATCSSAACAPCPHPSCSASTVLAMSPLAVIAHVDGESRPAPPDLDGPILTSSDDPTGVWTAEYCRTSG